MGDIIIFCMTIAIIIYLYYILFQNRSSLSLYLTSTGGNKPKVYNIKPWISFSFTCIYITIGILVGIIVFNNESDKGILIRVLVAINTSLFILLFILIIYFFIVIAIKEIIAMRDKSINTVLIYSIITFIILSYQLFISSIEYSEAFVGASIILYIMNIFSIGRIIIIILKKKVSVKSIWCISIINLLFAIFSLTNIAFQLQSMYQGICYSGQFKSWMDALYFVVITFFTVGYGDLYPTHILSKILSMVIIITGFAFSTICVSAVLSATFEHFANKENK